MEKPIKNLFNKWEIEYETSKEGIIDFYFFTSWIESGVANGLIAINKEEQQVMLHATQSTFVPENRRKEVSELLVRINYDDYLGGFIMDFEDGHVGYQCGYIWMQSDVNYLNVIEKYFIESLSKLNYYFPAILKVSYGEKGAGQVLAELIHQVDPTLN
ncbi:MAG: YbjN domain-containing protein [Balneola sp.]